MLKRVGMLGVYIKDKKKKQIKCFLTSMLIFRKIYEILALYIGRTIHWSIV